MVPTAPPQPTELLTGLRNGAATVSLQRVAVVGAGALGCYYGGRMAQSGRDVCLLLRRPEWRRAVLADGLQVRSVGGDFLVWPRVAATPTDLNPTDLVVIGLKSTSNADIEGLIRPLLTAAANDQKFPAFLTLQNGLGNEEALLEALRRILGPELAAKVPVAGGIAFICSSRGEAGTIHHTAHGWVKAGWFQAGPTGASIPIAETLRECGIPCEWEQNLLAARYEKLVWNIPFNGLGVATGATVADILGDVELLTMARSLMAEVLALARAEGCPLGESVAEDMISRSYTMGAYRTSMQIDYEEGRVLEVRAILGEPLVRARRLGLAVPHLEMLHAIVASRDTLARDLSRGGHHAG